jgi:hypothetical protein
MATSPFKDLISAISTMRTEAKHYPKLLAFSMIPTALAIIIFLTIYFTAPQGSYWPLDTLSLLIPLTFFATIYTVLGYSKSLTSKKEVGD